MGASCSRMQHRRPFNRLRTFFEARRERRNERRRRKELEQMGVNAADVDPRFHSPLLDGIASHHSSLASTSLNVTDRSEQTLSSSNSSRSSSSNTDSSPAHWNMLQRTAKNINDDDDDDTGGSGDSDEGIPLGASRPSDKYLGSSGNDVDTDDEVEDACTGNLRLRRYVSDQSEVHRRVIEADDARRRALHRNAQSLTVARLPTIPENDILASVANVAQPFPALPPRRQRQDAPEDFHLPGFIP